MINNYSQLCPAHVECPDSHRSNHPRHDLHCALPARYAHATHWAICQYAIHPDITTWDHMPETEDT